MLLKYFAQHIIADVALIQIYLVSTRAGVLSGQCGQLHGGDPAFGFAVNRVDILVGDIKAHGVVKELTAFVFRKGQQARVYVLDPPTDAPAGQGQWRFGSGRQGYQNTRRKIINEIGELPVDGRVANEVEIVQHQRPRAVIMSQRVDQAGNGFGKRVI